MRVQSEETPSSDMPAAADARFSDSMAHPGAVASPPATFHIPAHEVYGS